MSHEPTNPATPAAPVLVPDARPKPANPERHAALAAIAKQHLRIETLETQRTGADFAEQAVWRFRAALEAAYEAGAANRPAVESDRELPAFLRNAIDEVAEHLEDDTASGRVAAAQELIQAGIEFLCKVARETNDDNAEVYIIDPLSSYIGDGHGRDDNLDRWQDRLRRAEDGDDEDEE